MQINKTKIEGAFTIKSNVLGDERGSFVRFFCNQVLEPIIADRKIVQINHSITTKLGTIRGLHFQ